MRRPFEPKDSGESDGSGSVPLPRLQIVVGSGPAAQKCAIDSVKRGKRVALIDKNSQMGGVCVVR